MSEERAPYMAWRPAIAADVGLQVRFRIHEEADWLPGKLIRFYTTDNIAAFVCLGEDNQEYVVLFGDCEVQYDRNALP